MRSIGLLLGVPFLGAFQDVEKVSGREEPITVVDEAFGCMGSEPDPEELRRLQNRHYQWDPVLGGHGMGWRFVSTAQVSELRALLMSHRVTPPDLLAVIGIDPDTIARHREEILRTALDLQEGEPLRALGPELERLLSYEVFAPHILAEVQGRNWTSTLKQHFEVVLPGEPRITVSSHGLVPWMLPWKVSAGAESWEVADPAISRALLPLADPQGNCAPLLDGTRYWSTGFWSDPRFWQRIVGEPVRQAWAMEEIAQLAGYAMFRQRFRVREVAKRPDVNWGWDSYCSEISAEGTVVIDAARWSNLLDEEDQPMSDWNDFVALYDRATPVVARQKWMLAWKQAAPERTIELDAVGLRGIAGYMLEELVMPAWRDAGFKGEPQYQIDLRRGREWCGRVYLNEAESGALIETAKPGERLHWFDELDFFFHPKGDGTYGRVDARGTFELRHMPVPAPRTRSRGK